MYEYDRLDSILNILRSDRSASVTNLAQQLYVSESTIRRDLNTLTSKGLVRRVFGGVVLLENEQANSMYVPFYSSTMNNFQLKSTIAKKAIDFVEDGDTIMLDASMTVGLMIPYLKHFSGLTIITNASTAMAGLQDLDAKIYCTGGQMLRNSQGYVGKYAEKMICSFHANKLFFTTRGLSREGNISEGSEEEMSVHRTMLDHSYKHIMLCDSTKFGYIFNYYLGTLNEIDEFVSDIPFDVWLAEHPNQKNKMGSQANPSNPQLKE